MGKVWTLQGAKRRSSAVMEAAQRGEPQHVTKRGAGAVIVLSAEEHARRSRLDATSKEILVGHSLEFPTFPWGMEDIFDDRPEREMPAGRCYE